MQNNQVLLFLIVVSLLFYIILFKVYVRNDNDLEIIKSDTIFSTKIIEIPIHNYFEKPNPIYIEKLIYQEVDSSAIIANAFKTFEKYSTKNYYDLPLLSDSNGNLKLKTYIQFNEIQSYELIGNLRGKTETIIVNNTTTLKSKNQVLGGLILTSDFEKMDIFPVISFVNKKNQVFIIGWSPISKSGLVGVNFRIWKK